MLRLLFRYALLPFTALVLLSYAAIPLWAPSVASLLLKPYQFQDINLKVGYPTHNRWNLTQVSFRQNTPAGSYFVVVDDINLRYTWQTIKAKQWPHFDATNAVVKLEAAPQSLSLAPSIALLPSQWLTHWPTFMVANFNLDLSADGEQYQFAGQLENQADGLGILSKISMPSRQILYLDAIFRINNQVDAKLFATQSSAPVAKLTSNIKRQGSNYIWQGQGAINLAYSQKMLSHLLALDLAETTITQGKVNSHWKVSLPVDINEADRVDFASLLNKAQGEIQSQVQLAASNPNVKELYADASLTQKLRPNTPSQWRLNEGSTVRVTPTGDNTKIDPDLYQLLLLEQAQLTFSADTPVWIERVVETNILGSKSGLLLDGTINATLENTDSVYQVFGQLTQLQVHSLHHWQGIADLSGYYIAPQASNAWMRGLPIELRQLQFLSRIGFDFDPKQWQFNLQPNSKLSATQVESRRKAGSVQLFASDKLNLTSDNAIKLAYLPEQDYWSWSDISVHLMPESVPSQGLEVSLGEGSNLLSNRPIEGSFELLPTVVNLPQWPNFQAVSLGQFNWLDGQLKIDFTADLAPYMSGLNGQYIWQEASNNHQLLIQAEQVNLPNLMSQFSQLGADIDLPQQFLVDVTSGVASIDAQWRWNDTKVSGEQTLNYANVNAHKSNIYATGLVGKSQFDYSYVYASEQATKATLVSDHQLSASKLSFGNESVAFMINPTLSLKTQGLKDPVYDVALFDANWLGGRVSATKASIQSDRLNTVAIKLQDLMLSRLVTLAKTPALKITGQMSGKAHLTLDLTSPGEQGFELADADLSSSSVGTIEYSPNDPTDETQEAQYLQQILSQFEFQSLSAKLRHNQDGQLELLTQLKGSNAQFEAGKSIDFSLTLNPKLH
ncbi:MAG: YdbH domain-containing protein [Oceanospirillaceae bacterium]|nr:YdbH domain-containing protein [Oceanospirillaceae bacterium]